jgi:para-nitrobenzyl esterase
LLSEAEMIAELSRRYAGKSAEVLAAARTIYPKAKPVELLSLISRPRSNAIAQATRKYEQRGAGVYMYLFAWQTPILDGRPRAFHCSEIPFVFDNTDVSAFATGGTAEARALGAKVSDAWIAFAKRGNPNHPGLPAWPVFAPDKGSLMVFDTTCVVQHDPDRALRDLTSAT